MKTSDFIVEFLISKGITDVFGYPGGMVTHLMDSLEKAKARIRAHLCYHEQAAAFAACGYAQASGKVGVAYATSGPGVTNLLTGIAHAYFDSVPAIFFTGQVNTYEQKGALAVRQLGFQEMEVVNIVRPIAKYAVSVKTPEQLAVELEKAYTIATTGRMGPVVIDLPMDVQRKSLDQGLADAILSGAEAKADRHPGYSNLADGIDRISSAIRNASRPLIIAGAGIASSNSKEQFRQAVQHLNIPVVTSMIAVDALPSDSPLNFGFLGAYGNRVANFIVSKADLILSIGSRMDVRQTGNDKKIFAPHAKIIRIDFDADELTNVIHEGEEHLILDLRPVLEQLMGISGLETKSDWLDECRKYKEVLSDYDQTEGNLVVRKIGGLIPDHAMITTDVGQNQVWVAQSFPIKENQKVLFSGGHGAMGYSLPAAIGAYYASGKPVFSFNGDGGLQMNIQELQFLVRERIPVKIVILNNHSLGMIRHFQEMYFDSVFAQTKHEHGYSAPDFVRIAQAYGINSIDVQPQSLNPAELKDILEAEGPALINVYMSDTTFTYPKLAMGKPLYDQEPPLDRELLQSLLDYKGK